MYSSNLYYHNICLSLYLHCLCCIYTYTFYYQVALLQLAQKETGLQTKEAGDAFADVVNAMLVTLVDRGVDLQEDRDRTKNRKLTGPEKETAVGMAMERLSDFALSAGDLFAGALPGVVLADGGIRYNGSAKKGSLETVFGTFLKSSSGNVTAMLKGIFDEGSCMYCLYVC